MNSDDAYLFRRATTGTSLVGRSCFDCNLRLALFVVLNRFVSVCPGCATERIAGLRQELGSLPDWLQWFSKEVEKEVQFQRRKQDNSFELRWDDLFRCADCDKVVHERDARYHFEPEVHSSPPYCLVCYNRRASTQPEG